MAHRLATDRTLRDGGARGAAPAPRGLRARRRWKRRCAVTSRRCDRAAGGRVRRPALRPRDHGRLGVAGARDRRAAAATTTRSRCSRRAPCDYVTWRNALPAGESDVSGVDVRRFPVAAERDLDAFNALLGDAVPRAAARARRSSSGCGARARRRRPSWTRWPRRRTASTPSCSSPTSITRPTGGSRRRRAGRCSCPPPTTSRRCASRSTTRCSRGRAPSRSSPAPRRTSSARASGWGIARPRSPGSGSTSRRRPTCPGSAPAIPSTVRTRSTRDASTPARAARRWSRITRPTARAAARRTWCSSARWPWSCRRCPGCATSGSCPTRTRRRPSPGPGWSCARARTRACPSCCWRPSRPSVPGLVNARSAVLKDHCLRANAGLFYETADEFAAALDLLVTDDELRRAHGRGRAAVRAGALPLAGRARPLSRAHRGRGGPGPPPRGGLRGGH